MADNGLGVELRSSRASDAGAAAKNQAGNYTYHWAGEQELCSS
jgi:hypothetical protein